MIFVYESKMDSRFPRRRDHGVGTTWELGEHGVEERVMDYPDPSADKITGKPDGAGVDGVRDLAQTVRPVIDGVHAGRHGEQDLRCADVRGRLLAADVLLSGLQCQTEAGRAVAILGDPDEPTRQGAFQAGADGHESRMRPTVEKRDAETLA